jgi:HSP20 family protein
MIPWNRGQDVTMRRGEEMNPFLTLHREMNRLFDDIFQGFGRMPFRGGGVFEGTTGWPNLEVNETDKEVRVTAELPGLDQKDIDVQIANGVLAIKGERKTETEDKDRRFSERFYGRFERRIPIEDVEQDAVTATFKNGLLTVTLPKSEKAQSKVKRIPLKAS